MRLTPAQKDLQRQNFYKNGLYIPTRTIILGTNVFSSEDTEFTQVDLTDLIKSLILLEVEKPDDEEDSLIKIILGSEGGDPYLGFAAYDAIKACSSPVEIRAIGKVMSAATIILSAGDYRYAYPNTTFMIHKGSLEFESTSVDDATIAAAESNRIANKMMDIYEDVMSISRKEIEALMEKDSYLDVAKAKKIGLIDGWKERFDL